MIPAIFEFLNTKIGRWIAGIVALAIAFPAVYTAGDLHGRKVAKAAIEQEKIDAIKKGKQGAADALKNLTDNKIPDYWWRD